MDELEARVIIDETVESLGRKINRDDRESVEARLEYVLEQHSEVDPRALRVPFELSALTYALTKGYYHSCFRDCAKFLACGDGLGLVALGSFRSAGYLLEQDYSRESLLYLGSVVSGALSMAMGMASLALGAMCFVFGVEGYISHKRSKLRSLTLEEKRLNDYIWQEEKKGEE